MRCHGTDLRALAGFRPLLILLVLALPAPLFGQNVVRVEEDWELQLRAPDQLANAPQVTCAISPARDLNGLHALFELNHRPMNAYWAGGLQLVAWEGLVPRVQKDGASGAVLSTEGEVVTWKQCMSLNGEGSIVFEIIDGSSTTWGAFGGDGNLKATLATTLANLNGYHPDVTVANSRVGFAGNRVRALVLKRVRLVTDTGLVLEDSTERVVHRID